MAKQNRIKRPIPYEHKVICIDCGATPEDKYDPNPQGFNCNLENEWLCDACLDGHAAAQDERNLRL